MTADEKWTARWAWMTTFPTTNAKAILGMWLLTAVVITPLAMMLTGHKTDIDESVVGLLLGGILGVLGIGSWQKVQKWKQMPDSSVDEPPPPMTAETEARQVAGREVLAPNVSARPDLGVPDKGVL